MMLLGQEFESDRLQLPLLDHVICLRMRENSFLARDLQVSIHANQAGTIRELVIDDGHLEMRAERLFQLSK